MNVFVMNKHIKQFMNYFVMNKQIKQFMNIFVTIHESLCYEQTNKTIQHNSQIFLLTTKP